MTKRARLSPDEIIGFIVDAMVVAVVVVVLASYFRGDLPLAPLAHSASGARDGFSVFIVIGWGLMVMLIQSSTGVGTLGILRKRNRKARLSKGKKVSSAAQLSSDSWSWSWMSLFWIVQGSALWSPHMIWLAVPLAVVSIRRTWTAFSVIVTAMTIGFLATQYSMRGSLAVEDIVLTFFLTALVVIIKIAMDSQRSAQQRSDFLGRENSILRDCLDLRRRIAAGGSPSVVDSRAGSALIETTGKPDGVVINVNAPQGLQGLPADQASAVLLATNVLVSTILREAGAQRVDVHLEVTPTMALLSIIDDAEMPYRGVGLSAREASQCSAKDLVAKLGGRLKTTCGIATGTLVEALLPLSPTDEVQRLDADWEADSLIPQWASHAQTPQLAASAAASHAN